ncbi:hypothetical protein QJS66_22905 [Kocuria rhizophila]|nr:hypothetical protein QJS66_22905 [Kocuria rhizophila]
MALALWRRCSPHDAACWPARGLRRPWRSASPPPPWGCGARPHWASGRGAAAAPHDADPGRDSRRTTRTSTTTRCATSRTGSCSPSAVWGGDRR